MAVEFYGVNWTVIWLRGILPPLFVGDITIFKTLVFSMFVCDCLFHYISIFITCSDFVIVKYFVFHFVIMYGDYGLFY